MPKIEEMFAFVAEESPGEEGVAAFRSHKGYWMPMVAADSGRVDSLREIARVTARDLGKPIRLIRFSVRHDIEIIEP